MTITKIRLGNSSSGPQTMTVQYKRWDQPIGDYVTISATVTVDVNGNLSVPLVTPTLVPGQKYDFRISNNCSGSSIPAYVQQITA